jgi:hypothetical protein
MVTAVMAEARVGRWHKLTRSGWSWLGQAADIVVVMPVQPSAVRAAAWRRRLVVLGLLRALATAVVLVGLYYLLPLDHVRNVPLTLAVGLVILLVVIAWQLRAIVRARQPVLRAIVALATTVPLFVLLFASVYFVMADRVSRHSRAMVRRNCLTDLVRSAEFARGFLDSRIDVLSCSRPAPIVRTVRLRPGRACVCPAWRPQ